MARSPLPTPRTTSDVLLHDIATSLRTIVDRTSTAGSNPSRLEEPATPGGQPARSNAPKKKTTRRKG